MRVPGILALARERLWAPRCKWKTGINQDALWAKHHTRSSNLLQVSLPNNNLVFFKMGAQGQRNCFPNYGQESGGGGWGWGGQSMHGRGA